MGAGRINNIWEENYIGATVIAGGSWGDEGKGKMMDALAADSSYAVRFQGGSNAGHTIMNEYDLYGKATIHRDDLMEEIVTHGNSLKPYLCDTTELLQGASAKGERILLEGQLGALRDPDHGIYPYTTSSSTLAGYATVGAGLPHSAIDKVIAVVKAYSSCVGAGPFVAELEGVEAEKLRRRGGADGEYGATTGRPRRVGWFDAVATRYGCLLQGADEVALTNLDVLGYLDQIPICTGYRLQDGSLTNRFPTGAMLEGAEPVWEYCAGWGDCISHIREYDALPPAARHYVETIETLIGVKITYVSVGPGREQLIVR